MIEVNKIYFSNCSKGLKHIPDNFIDCCVTSPPYWGLRDYGMEDQLGLEKTPEEYVKKLMGIFSEIKRILKSRGTCFVNLGDTYSGSGKVVGGKCLYQIPSRFSIAMTNAGWILRNEIIWYKPNAMPTSASDRFTVDFEKIFFFTKQQKYYFEQQLEPYTTPLDRWGGEQITPDKESTWDKGTGQKSYRKRKLRPNDEGRNKRSVWTINTVPLKEAHFATFPEELIVPMIKAGCPEGGIVLDPFMGAGTTGLVAKKLNRNYIGFELNPEYIDIAEKRINKYFLISRG